MVLSLAPIVIENVPILPCVFEKATKSVPKIRRISQLAARSPLFKSRHAQLAAQLAYRRSKFAARSFQFAGLLLFLLTRLPCTQAAGVRRCEASDVHSFVSEYNVCYPLIISHHMTRPASKNIQICQICLRRFLQGPIQRHFWTPAS